MNICSSLALADLKRAGKISRQQSYYLYVFTRYSSLPEAMSHHKATSIVFEIFGHRLADRNGRIRELEEMGFIRKDGQTTCPDTHKTVNTYIWTGRIEPLPCKQEFVPCPHCEGRGGKVRKVYFKEEGQRVIDFTRSNKVIDSNLW